MREETVKLITEIYRLFEDNESNMFDAYLSALSIAASIACQHNVTEDEFLLDCKACFADGETVKVNSFTIN